MIDRFEGKTETNKSCVRVCRSIATNMDNCSQFHRLFCCLQFVLLICGFGVDGFCTYDKSFVGEWILFDSQHQLSGEYRIANGTIYPPLALQQEKSIGQIHCVEKFDNIYLLVNRIAKTALDSQDNEDEYFCSLFTRRSANFIEWMHYYASPNRLGNYHVRSSCQVDVIRQGGTPDISKYGRWTPLYAKSPKPVVCPLNSLYHYAFTHTDPINTDRAAPLDSCNQLNSELDAGCTEVDTFKFDYSKCKHRQGNSDGGRFSCLATWSANFTFRYNLKQHNYKLEEKELQYVMLRNEDTHVADTSVRKYFCYVLVHNWVTYGNDSDPDAEVERITFMSGVPIMCPPDIRPTGLFPNHFTEENQGEALLLKGKDGGNHNCQKPSALSSSATMVTVYLTTLSISLYISWVSNTLAL
ncbi:uncharacterized protein LOC144438488 [Glandiceps talaboti]